MTDIVEYLRAGHNTQHNCQKAADEIERLRESGANIEAELAGVVYEFAAIKADNERLREAASFAEQNERAMRRRLEEYIGYNTELRALLREAQTYGIPAELRMRIDAILSPASNTAPDDGRVIGADQSAVVRCDHSVINGGINTNGETWSYCGKCGRKFADTRLDPNGVLTTPSRQKQRDQPQPEQE